MKKLAGLIIVLAILVLSGFYGMGVITERSIKQGVEVINQSDGLHATIEQYHKGWFCSRAQLKWQLHIPERIVKNTNGQTQVIAAQDYQTQMPLKIYHGPIILANKRVYFGMGYAKAVFPFPEQYNAQFNEIFTSESVKPHLNFSFFVNYFNKRTLKLSLPAFKVMTKDGTGAIDWLGMNINNTSSSKGDSITGELESNGLNATKDDTKIAVGKVSAEYNVHKASSGLYLGDAGFTIPFLNVQIKDSKVFELSNLQVTSKSEGEELFSTQMDVRLKSVFVNNAVYGPGELKIAIRNLDAKTLSKLNDQAIAMENGTEEERQKAIIGMMPEIPQLFSRGVEFELSQFEVKLPQGTVEGNLLVTLPKKDNINPFELLQKVQGKATFKLPSIVVKQVMKQTLQQQLAKQPDLQQTLIQQLQTTQLQAGQTALTPEQIVAMQTDKRIATLEQNGLVQIEGSNYVVNLTLKEGKLTVNGKPFDDAMLKF